MNKALTRSGSKRLLKRSLALLSALLLLEANTVTPAIAASVPNFDRQVELAVQEATTKEYVEKLFSLIEVPVVVSDQVTGEVDKSFSGPASQLFKDLAKTTPVTVYYDGIRAYVYPARNVTSSLLEVPAKVGKNVIKQVARLDLADDMNKVSLSGKGLWVRGTDRFFEQVEEIKTVALKAEKTYVPEETTKIFKIKWGSAADYKVWKGEEEFLVRGIASSLILWQSGSVNISDVAPQRMRSNPETDESPVEGLQVVKQVKTDDANAEPDKSQAALRRSRPVNTAALSSPNVMIMAQESSNSIMIRDRADRMAGYERLIKLLDVKPAKIEIEATIIDMYTDRLRELGINWRLMDKNNDILFGDGTAADRLLKPGTEITPAGQGGAVSMMLGLNNGLEYIARIKALELEGAARIVSKPHIMTLSNKQAIMDTTKTSHVKLEGDDVDLRTIDVGTVLRVKPTAIEDGDRTPIMIDILIQDGSTISGQVVDDLPVVERSRIMTQTLVNVGESILLGGQVREVRTNSVSQVPWFSRIPIIGWFFNNNSKTSHRAERMFLITPRLVEDSRTGNRHIGEPVLEGSEKEIIATASTRLAEANVGIALRDQYSPLEESLPLETRSNGLTMPVIKQKPGDAAGAEPSRAPLLLEDSIDWQNIPESSPATLQVETLIIARDIDQAEEVSQVAPTAATRMVLQWHEID